MNLSSLDLNLLVLVDAVLDARSATLAASRLHVTQSAVSNGLKRARALFGDQLVVRRGSGFALTPAAEALAPRLRAVLDELRGILAGERRGPHWVTVACLDAITIGLVPPLLPLLREHLPQTRLRILTPDHVRMGGLERSEIGLVVGALRGLPAGCEAEVLFEDPLVVIASARHPKIRSRLSIETYAGSPHAELGLFGEPEDRVDRALAALGLVRQTQVVVPHLAALPFAVADSELIATVPRSVAWRFARGLGLRLHRPPLAVPPVVVKMSWHRRHAGDRIHATLRDLVRGAARRMVPEGPLRQRRAP